MFRSTLRQAARSARSFSTRAEAPVQRYTPVVIAATAATAFMAYQASRSSIKMDAPTGAYKPTYLPKDPSEVKGAKELTYIMVKGDGVQRGLVGEIISRFEKRGYKVVALKLASPTEAHFREHYADLSDKAFFPKLVKWMSEVGPVVCIAFEGKDAVKTGRVMLGATNPLASSPGTIRGDYAIDVGRNVCHGSDSVESALKEIALWFPEGINQYTVASSANVYE